MPRHGLLPALLLSFLALAVASCGRRDTPKVTSVAQGGATTATTEIRTTPDTQRGATTPTAKEPPLVPGAVRAAEYAGAFARDDAAARKTYNGKPVTLAGKVAQVHGGGQTLVLAGHRPNEGRPVEVSCHFLATEWDRVKAVRPGDRVVVRGTSDGGEMDGEVGLNKCTLVK